MGKKKKKNEKNEKPIKKKQLRRLQNAIASTALELPVQGEWLGDEEIAKIENDATVLSSISIRKAPTLRKQVLITADNASVAEALRRRITHDFRAQVLDTVLQGFSVFELNWEEEDGYYYPVPIERDYRDFALLDGALYFMHEPVPKLKAIYMTHRAKFNAQLGRPLYLTLFWLRRFKAASVRFWVEFLERFGKPWIVGKTEADKDEMARELYAMLAGDVAVIDETDDVKMVSPDGQGTFKDLVAYIDDQIREAILGSNLTANVKSGSYAATKAHKEVSEAIAQGDEHLLLEAIRKLTDAFVQLNGYTGDIEVELVPPQSHKSEQAERDATLAKAMGGAYRFTKDYIETTYGVKLETSEQSALSAKTPVALSAQTPKPLDAVTARIDTDALRELDITSAIASALQEAQSYEEAYGILVSSEHIDIEAMEELLARYIANAELLGLGDGDN